MKIAFLFFSLFFLNACVSAPDEQICPILSVARSYDVTFEYGRADINADAFEILTDMAKSAADGGAKICVAGLTGYDGVPDNLARLSLKRAQTVADIFVQNGVKIENIYLIIAPDAAQTGIWRPDSAKDVRHMVHIDAGF